VKGEYPMQETKGEFSGHMPGVLRMIDGVAFVAYGLLFRAVLEDREAALNVLKKLPVQGLGGEIL